MPGERPLLVATALLAIAVALMAIPDAQFESWGIVGVWERDALRWCGFFLALTAPVRALAGRWRMPGRNRWLVANLVPATLYLVTSEPVILVLWLAIGLAGVLSITFAVAEEYHHRTIEALVAGNRRR